MVKATYTELDHLLKVRVMVKIIAAKKAVPVPTRMEVKVPVLTKGVETTVLKIMEIMENIHKVKS